MQPEPKRVPNPTRRPAIASFVQDVSIFGGVGVQEKLQRGRRGDESEQEGRAPTEFAITGGEGAVDDPADPQGAADKQEEQRGGESKRDAAGEGGPGREMRPVDLHIGSTSFSQPATWSTTAERTPRDLTQNQVDTPPHGVGNLDGDISLF